MNISLAFTRIFFVILSVFFMTTYMLSSPLRTPTTNALIGVSLGSAFGMLLIGFDLLFKRFNLRAFNIAMVGIFLGYLMGQSLVLTLGAVLDISASSVSIKPHVLEIIKIGLFLFGIYLGTIMTLRASDELYISIPFVKFSPSSRKRKDLLLDLSALLDARLIDLAATGLFDRQLIIPHFIIKECHFQAEVGDEVARTKAKRALDNVKKLETTTHLEIRFNDTDFPEVKEMSGKLLRLARLLEANILTADGNKLQMAPLEGLRVINMHALSNALKPLMQAGELIKIKIQRYGKEPRQGVGYLDDGTMVVVNGGGNFIGEILEAHVLSVKHTTSGRMIFCNTSESLHGSVQDAPHKSLEDSVDEE